LITKADWWFVFGLSLGVEVEDPALVSRVPSWILSSCFFQVGLLFGVTVLHHPVFGICSILESLKLVQRSLVMVSVLSSVFRFSSSFNIT
jgi:hypothetical protein